MSNDKTVSRETREGVDTLEFAADLLCDIAGSVRVETTLLAMPIGHERNMLTALGASILEAIGGYLDDIAESRGEEDPDETGHERVLRLLMARRMVGAVEVSGEEPALPAVEPAKAESLPSTLGEPIIVPYASETISMLRVKYSFQAVDAGLYPVAALIYRPYNAEKIPPFFEHGVEKDQPEVFGPSINQLANGEFNIVVGNEEYVGPLTGAIQRLVEWARAEGLVGGAA